DRKPLAKVAKPAMVLIELLAAGQRAPRDELVDVGVVCRVTDLVALDSRPGRRRDDLPRLRLKIAEADLLIRARLRKMRAIATGLPATPQQCLHVSCAFGLRREIEVPLGSVEVSLDGRAACGLPAVDPRVQLAESARLVLGIPADAFAAVAE